MTNRRLLLRLAPCVLASVADGCGRLGFDSIARDAAPSEAAPADAPFCMANVSMLDDDFNDGVIGPAWTTYATNGTSAAETGGTIVLTPAANVSGNAYAGLVSTCAYDLRAAAVEIQVVAAPSGSTGNDFGFELDLDTSELGFDCEGGELAAHFHDEVTDQYVVYAMATWDQAAQRYWRLRGDTGQLVFETSPDDTQFSTLAKLPPPFDLSQVRVELFNGTYVASAAPEIVELDDLRGSP